MKLPARIKKLSTLISAILITKFNWRRNYSMTLDKIKNDVIGVWAGENLLRLNRQIPSDFNSRG